MGTKDNLKPRGTKRGAEVLASTSEEAGVDIRCKHRRSEAGWGHENEMEGGVNGSMRTEGRAMDGMNRGRGRWGRGIR